MKKMMLLALAAVCALLVVPSFASANPLHVSATGPFTVHGGASELTRTSGNGTKGKTITGNGTFETTTTGTVHLTFDEVTSEQLGSCENVTTTNLPFHLVTLNSGAPGILITSANNHFATFKCGFITVTVNGNGVLGTITSPACGGTSNKATLSFAKSVAGHQQHTSVTGVTYGLNSTILGVTSPSSMDATATITFPANRTLTCT
jgi:hypothetical protein